MEKPTFFARRSILILMIVFFLVPFALRGARLAIQGMKNDIKDWLPAEFQETAELDWFRKYFMSEQFIVVSWEDCHGDADDERFKLFVAKLMPELPPSQQPAEPAEGEEPTVEQVAAEVAADEEAVRNPTRMLERADFIGDQLGLYIPGGAEEFNNWGELNEKWLKGLKTLETTNNNECWYYITPEGDLYRWEGVDAPVATLGRWLYRSLVTKKTEGTLVYSFGKTDGPWYYENPKRLRAQLFKSLTTGPDVLESLTRDGGELAGDEEEAMRRLAGNLFGPDGKQTCLTLTLTPAAKRNLHLAIGRGLLGKPRGQLFEIAQQSNISEAELRLGGPPVDNVAIDEEGSITLFRLVGYTAILGITLSLICFRSITATVMIFFIGGISAVMCLAFVWWLGSSVDAIMMSMPALVYVLGLSGAAHIMNYYQEAIDEHGYEGACERAIAHGWKPALMCNITTAIGLVSLYTSELIPIQKFGIYSAIGVMATLLVLFTYLPAALYIWPQKQRKKLASGAAEPSKLDSYLTSFWQSFGGFIIRYHNTVAVLCVLVIIGVGYGLTEMRTSVNLLRMFHSEAKIIKDYEWLEANLGRLVPMEVVVKIPKDQQRAPLDDLKGVANEQVQLPFLDRMELAYRVQRTIESEFGDDGQGILGTAISAATFVRPLPQASGSALSARGTIGGRLEAHRGDFLKTDYLKVDDSDNSELWRVSLRLSATDSVDYGAFVTDLKSAVEPVLSAQRYRDNIMQSIIVDREGGRTAGARVLLLGATIPPPAKKAQAAEEEEIDPTELSSADRAEMEAAKAAASAKATLAADSPKKANAKASIKTDHHVDQTAIFSRTLRDMLVGARLRVNMADTLAPAELEKALADCDVVVLVGSDKTYPLDAINQSGKRMIDAREHQFAGMDIATMVAKGDVPRATSAIYTGVVPIVYKAQRSLLDSLIESTFWSVLTISPLMMFLARAIDTTSTLTIIKTTITSIGAGGVAMLPNVLPVVMVFGGMGWLKIEVDVGSMMTASIALGVAVDDTIHYLNWFREELDKQGDRKLAIMAAYRHCATPTLQAATISGLGLSVFAASTFTPTQRFGYLMLTILWLGVVAELIFFPALLAGPLGAFFQPRKYKKKDEGSTGPSTAASPLKLKSLEKSEEELDAVVTPAIAKLSVYKEVDPPASMLAEESKPINSLDTPVADPSSALDDEESVVPPSKSAILRSLRHDPSHRNRKR